LKKWGAPTRGWGRRVKALKAAAPPVTILGSDSDSMPCHAPFERREISFGLRGQCLRYVRKREVKKLWVERSMRSVATSFAGADGESLACVDLHPFRG